MIIVMVMFLAAIFFVLMFSMTAGSYIDEQQFVIQNLWKKKEIPIVSIKKVEIAEGKGGLLVTLYTENGNHTCTTPYSFHELSRPLKKVQPDIMIEKKNE